MIKPLFQNILVMVNGTDASINAVRYAVLMAKLYRCRVYATYVVDTATIKQLTLNRIFIEEESREYEQSLEDNGKRYLSFVEEMAQAEFRLAEAAAQSGDRQTAQQRMEYLLRYYPHSSVARQASDWLEHATRDEPDNTPPGTAW